MAPLAAGHCQENPLHGPWRRNQTACARRSLRSNDERAEGRIRTRRVCR
jgi:hypothetical protein